MSAAPPPPRPPLDDATRCTSNSVEMTASIMGCRARFKCSAATCALFAAERRVSPIKFEKSLHGTLHEQLDASTGRDGSLRGDTRQVKPGVKMRTCRAGTGADADVLKLQSGSRYALTFCPESEEFALTPAEVFEQRTWRQDYVIQQMDCCWTGESLPGPPTSPDLKFIPITLPHQSNLLKI